MGSRPLRRWPDVPPPGRVRQTNLPASLDGGCQVSATTEADRPTATGYGGGGVRVIHASIHAKGDKVENQLNARAMAWGTLYSQPYGDNAIRKTRHKATTPKVISTMLTQFTRPGPGLAWAALYQKMGLELPFPFLRAHYGNRWRCVRTDGIGNTSPPRTSLYPHLGWDSLSPYARRPRTKSIHRSRTCPEACPGPCRRHDPIQKEGRSDQQ